MKILRRYSDLIELKTFEERFEYLKLGGEVGKETFGYDRYLNQVFYSSPEWKKIRREIILRDDGNDLGLEGYPIFGKVIVHHMNPITLEDIDDRLDEILNLNFLICVSNITHNAIHYGDYSLCDKDLIERTKNDTKLW